MLIQTDEKSVTLTPFGSLVLNGDAANARTGGNASKGDGQSWIEMIRTRCLKLTKVVRTNCTDASLGGQRQKDTA